MENTTITTSRTLKLVLVGPPQSHKTMFVRASLCPDVPFDTKYIPTIGVEVHPVRFFHQGEEVCFNLWDCAGSEQFGGLREGYWIRADAFLVFDSTSSYSQERLALIREQYPQAKVVEWPHSSMPPPKILKKFL